MQAVSKDCQGINTQFERAKSLISEIGRGLPTAEELMAKASEVRQAVDNFSQLIKTHSQRMDVLLQMLKSVIWI